MRYAFAGRDFDEYDPIDEFEEAQDMCNKWDDEDSSDDDNEPWPSGFQNAVDSEEYEGY